MLSDEERQAIEWLKRLVKLNKRDNLDDTFAEILLNLIEKQSKEIERTNEILIWKQKHEEQLQKEIEELKEFKKQVEEIESTNFIKYKNYISKDKIKAKIDELDKQEEDLQNSISNEEREEYSDANISWELMDIQIRKEVLQSLVILKED